MIESRCGILCSECAYREGDMELIVKRYDELTLEELYEILKVRQEVFVIDQNCVFQDLDGLDQYALHIFLCDDSGIQAYLRLIEAGKSYEEVTIGRVLSKKRRCGLGTKIMLAGIEEAKDRMNATKIKIAAQSHAKTFYENMGFQQSSEEFMEEGIPHIEMILDI